MGAAHIKSTFNNTIVSITDPQGNVISWQSAGTVGFSAPQKSTPFAAQMAAEAAAKTAMEHGLKKVAVYVKGFRVPVARPPSAPCRLPASKWPASRLHPHPAQRLPPQEASPRVTERIVHYGNQQNSGSQALPSAGIDPVVLGYSSKKESIRQPKRRRKESEYAMQLREKQKAKFIYGVLEKQFRGYFKRAKSMEGQTGENLMTILETRLDNVVFPSGLRPHPQGSPPDGDHGRICVNGRRVDIPSFRVRPGELVSVAPKARSFSVKSALVSNERVQVPAWLEIDIEKLQGSVLSLPTRDQIDLDINEQLIVELYSK